MSIRSQTGIPGLARNAPIPQIVDKINEMNRGHINPHIDVTLRANQVTTTLADPRIGPNSYIDFMAQTANAATAKANIYVTARIKGQATINHASSANVDQSFTAVILGP